MCVCFALCCAPWTCEAATENSVVASKSHGFMVELHHEITQTHQHINSSIKIPCLFGLHQFSDKIYSFWIAEVHRSRHTKFRLWLRIYTMHPKPEFVSLPTTKHVHSHAQTHIEMYITHTRAHIWLYGCVLKHWLEIIWVNEMVFFYILFVAFLLQELNFRCFDALFVDAYPCIHVLCIYTRFHFA